MTTNVEYWEREICIYCCWKYKLVDSLSLEISMKVYKNEHLEVDNLYNPTIPPQTCTQITLNLIKEMFVHLC